MKYSLFGERSSVGQPKKQEWPERLSSQQPSERLQQQATPIRLCSANTSPNRRIERSMHTKIGIDRDQCWRSNLNCTSLALSFRMLTPKKVVNLFKQAYTCSLTQRSVRHDKLNRVSEFLSGPFTNQWLHQQKLFTRSFKEAEAKSMS
jgi:hypothetical protein